MNTTYSYIANAIKEYCFLNKYTYNAFSKLVGVSERTIQRWLIASVSIPKFRRTKLSEILNIDIESRFKFDALEQVYNDFLNIDKLYTDFKTTDDIFLKRKLFNIITTLFYNRFLDCDIKITLGFDEDNNSLFKFSSPSLIDSYIVMSHTTDDITFSYIHKEKMVTNRVSATALKHLIDTLHEIL